jgi:hypothetical protein
MNRSQTVQLLQIPNISEFDFIKYQQISVCGVDQPISVFESKIAINLFARAMQAEAAAGIEPTSAYLAAMGTPAHLSPREKRVFQFFHFLTQYCGNRTHFLMASFELQTHALARTPRSFSIHRLRHQDLRSPFT